MSDYAEEGYTDLLSYSEDDALYVPVLESDSGSDIGSTYSDGSGVSGLGDSSSDVLTNLTTDETEASAISGGNLVDSITMQKDTHVKSEGVTAYNDGVGYYFGWDPTLEKFVFFFGDSAGDKVTWNGSAFSITGTVIADSGSVGGWTLTTDTLYSLASGTPTSSPTDGIIIDSSNPVIQVYEDAAKRIELGYLSAGVFGLKGYATNGTTVLFELSDTQAMIAGWNFQENYLYNLVSGTPTAVPNDGVVLDAANGALLVYEDTAKRLEVGYLSSGIYGLRVYATDGVTVIWETSDTQQMAGGWNFDNAYFWGLASGTPTASPNDGIVLASGSTGGVRVYEDTAKRVELGYLSSGIYGIKGYATDGTTVVFEMSDTQQMLGGFYFTNTTLATNATTASANVLIDAGNSLFRLGPTSGSYITIDGANQRIQSSNYVSGINGAGFTLEPDLLEVGNIAARGIIRTAVFQKDVVSTVGGNFQVSDSDVLSTDMTALDASTLTIEGNTTFSVGDILHIKDGTDDEWMTITSAVSAPTYSVTRDEAGSYAADTNPAWTKGATVVNVKQSGDGFVYMTASETNAPYLSVVTHAGSPWSALTTRARLGNLNGYLGYVADIYGLGIGSNGAGEANLTFDPTNGIRLRSGTTTLISLDMSGGASIAGWSIVDGYIYNLQSGTPIASPNDGIVLASGNEGIIIYEDTAKRIELGYLSAGVYGLKGYATDGTTVLFEMSDTQQILAGWTLSQTTLANGTDIILDASNKAISINDSTYGNQGLQFQFNGGTPRMYVGDGANQSFEFNGTNAKVNGTGLTFEDLFGDGAGGSHTTAGNETLTADVFYTNLTVSAGDTITTAGFRIFVNGTLTVASTGVIKYNGNNGGNGGDASAVADGTAGSAAAALADGSIKGAVGGQAGGVSGGVGTAGTSVAKSIGAAGVAGGAGNNPGGADPAGGAAGSQTGTVYNYPRSGMAAYLLYDFLPSGDNLKSSSGSGSGAGGDDDGGSTHGGGGGGSGGPGGIVEIFARTIVNNGTISANGGNGGDGGDGYAATGRGGGGGGGGAGSGGVVILVYTSKSGSGSETVAGGTGGAGGLGIQNGSPNATYDGAVGSDGNTGTLIEITV